MPRSRQGSVWPGGRCAGTSRTSSPSSASTTAQLRSRRCVGTRRRRRPGPPVSVTDFGQQLEAAVDCGLPGVVAVVVGPGNTHEAAAGVANLETGEPMTPDRCFHIGSVMKAFVATIVLQLVDEGALDLDGDSRIVEGVTVRQLLNHTSGLPDFFDDITEVFEPYQKDLAYRWPLGPYEMLAIDKEKPRLFEPGAGWSYRGSN